MNAMKQLPYDLQDMIYTQLHKSYMKDVNIEIEQYEKKKWKRSIFLNRIVLLYRRLLRNVYLDKINFLNGYYEFYYLERKIRYIFKEKGGKHQYQYSIIDLVLDDIIPNDNI